MTDPGDVLPDGSEADVREQQRPVESEQSTRDVSLTGGGTGGSEADRQEEWEPLVGGGSAFRIDPAADGTGGSEADRLEQAATVPLGGEDAYPHDEPGSSP